jgi:hypothetical protein
MRLLCVPVLVDDPDHEIVAAAKLIEGTPLDLVKVLSLPILRGVIGISSVLMEECPYLVRVQMYVLYYTEGGAHTDIINNHFVFLLI